MISKKVGSSIKYLFNIKDSTGAKIDITDYTLNLKISQTSGGADIINRAVTSKTDDNLNFVVELTPADTTLMGSGSFIACNKIANAATDYADEEEVLIKLSPSCF